MTHRWLQPLRRLLCAFGWASLAFGLVVIAVTVVTDNASQPWRSVTRIGIPTSFMFLFLWMGKRGWLPGTERSFNRRSLVIGPAIIVVAIVVEVSWMGLMLDSAPAPESAELARVRAEFKALLDEPVLKNIGISQDTVVRSIGVTTPMVRAEDKPYMGRHRLVGYNREDRIQIKVQGPEENLWSVYLFFLLENGRLDVTQPSSRRVKLFLDQWLGYEAWVWISQMADVLIPNGTEEQKVQRTFRDKNLTLSMAGPSAKNPSTLSILVLPATEEPQQQPVTVTSTPASQPIESESNPSNQKALRFHPLD